MKKLAQVMGTLAVGTVLMVSSAQAQLGTSAESGLFAPEVTLPLCIDFDSFTDGIEVSAIMPDNMVVATWQNWDGLGSAAPMLGGFSAGPPKRAYLMSDIGTFAPGDVFGFTIELDSGTLDLRLHEANGIVTVFQNDVLYTIVPGACPFAPQGSGPVSTAAQ